MTDRPALATCRLAFSSVSLLFFFPFFFFSFVFLAFTPSRMMALWRGGRGTLS